MVFWFLQQWTRSAGFPAAEWRLGWRGKKWSQDCWGVQVEGKGLLQSPGVGAKEDECLRDMWKWLRGAWR